MKHGALLASTLVLLAGMAWTSPAAEPPLGAGSPEPLLGMMVDGEGVTFSVRSAGCTTKEHFVVKTLNTSPRHVDLVRLIPDRCEPGQPYGAMLRYTWEELGVGLGQWYDIGNHLNRFGHVPAVLPPGPAATDCPECGPVPAWRAETLLGYMVSQHGITYRVRDDGCVTKQDFAIHTVGTQPRLVLLLRRGNGICKDVQDVRPFWKDLSYSWQELGMGGGQRFEIGNGVQSIGIRLTY